MISPHGGCQDALDDCGVKLSAAVSSVFGRFVASCLGFLDDDVVDSSGGGVQVT